MINKLKKISGLIVIVIFLLITMSFADNKTRDITFSKIEVVIADSADNRFVADEDILEIIEREELKILGYPIETVNTAELEKLLKKHPPVKHVEVFATINGVLTIQVLQREPILRIMDYTGRDYYIDNDGIIMPLSEKYASHVAVANGYIYDKIKISHRSSVMSPARDSLYEGKRDILKELYTLGHYIYHDPVWKAQIEQIYVRKNQEFELIPRVGANVIYFGTAHNYQYKFRKLMAFYEKGLNNLGWNEYETINLKYSNQVICTKR